MLKISTSSFNPLALAVATNVVLTNKLQVSQFELKQAKAIIVQLQTKITRMVDPDVSCSTSKSTASFPSTSSDTAGAKRQLSETKGCPGSTSTFTSSDSPILFRKKKLCSEKNENSFACPRRALNLIKDEDIGEEVEFDLKADSIREEIEVDTDDDLDDDDHSAIKNKTIPDILDPGCVVDCCKDDSDISDKLEVASTEGNEDTSKLLKSVMDMQQRGIGQDVKKLFWNYVQSLVENKEGLGQMGPPGSSLPFRKSFLVCLKKKKWLLGDTIDFYVNILDRDNLETDYMVFSTISGAWAINGDYNDQHFKVAIEKTFAGINVETVRHIYFPLHCNGNHWILIAVNLTTSAISLLDSISHFKVAVSMFSLLDKVKTFMVGLYRFHSKMTLNSKDLQQHGKVVSWTLHSMDCPKQDNGCDCGVFVIAALECLCGKRAFNFTQRDIPFFRLKIAATLLNSFHFYSSTTTSAVSAESSTMSSSPSSSSSLIVPPSIVNTTSAVSVELADDVSFIVTQIKSMGSDVFASILLKSNKSITEVKSKKWTQQKWIDSNGVRSITIAESKLHPDVLPLFQALVHCFPHHKVKFEMIVKEEDTISQGSFN